MKIRNRILSGLVAVAMMVTTMTTTAFAATADVQNGSYTGTVHMYNASNTANYSMCDSMFYRYADVTVSDEATTVVVYAGSPLPNFSTIETLGASHATYNGTDYEAVIDSTTKPSKTFDAASALGGFAAGDTLTCQIITYTLPADAIDALDDGITVTSTVNAMGSEAEMVMKITDLTKAAKEKTEQSMTVTANVTAPMATYSVVIPESVTLGTLNTASDNVLAYNVSVEADNITGVGKVVVASPTTGELTSGTNTLAFANSFGEQTVSADTTATTLTGNMTILSTDVVAASAGNYSGTTTFTISYFED